ncbi:MAG: succinylglutamate desuccinylase/aspartoacylase family protein [Candidatus Cloacimonetes bacterium]|nr:succinylglutamate desuccinylase/aspartoacylase family protein [Candidatus Cloacimonadota bacterium]
MNKTKKPLPKIVRCLALLSIITIYSYLDLYSAPTSKTTYFSGTNYELDVYTIKGDKPGASLLIIGGIHGDEKSSFLAADYFADVTIENGTITLLPRTNLPAIMANRRFLNVDMNRRFDHTTVAGGNFYEDLVVAVVKEYMQKSDFVLNLHEGSGFYRHAYDNDTHNQMKYGQSIIADADRFIDKEGNEVNIKELAEIICARVNQKIDNPEYHFRFNNHNTSEESTAHLEQRKSATYYGYGKLKIPSFGIEISKQLPTQELKNDYKRLVLTEFINYLEIKMETVPYQHEAPVLIYLLVKINNEKRYFEPNDIITLEENSTLQITSINTNYTRGNYASVLSFGNKNDLNKVFTIKNNTEIAVYRDHQVTATIPVRIKTDTRFTEGFRIRLLDVPPYSQQDSLHLINIYPNETVAITEGVEFEIVGALNNDKNYDVTVVGANPTMAAGNQIIDTGKGLSYRYAINNDKNLYEILMKNDNNLVAKAYLKIKPIEAFGLHLTHNGKEVILAPNDTLYTNYGDTIYIHDVELNQLASHKIKVNFAGYIVHKDREAEDRGGDIVLDNRGLIPSFSTSEKKDLYEIHVLYKQKRYAYYYVKIKM